tara:strand:- start:859 stop:1221 length:363 start_codon:yes stop_codon:yes gene_type:complete
MEIKLTFEKPLNQSLQVGDTVWWVDTAQSGGYNVADSTQAMKLGTVEELSNQYRAHKVTISNYILNSAPDLTNAFIMFSKDNRANLTSLIGYYADVKFENNSKEKAELFTVGSEIVESSK